MIALLFMSIRHKFGREILNGVYRASHESGWSVQQIEDIPSRAGIRELINVWRPVGCLVYTESAQDLLPPRFFGSTPVVYLSDRHPNRLTVNQDAVATVALAVEELIRAGSRSLAYIGPDLDVNWNRERREAVCAEARRRKLPFSAFTLKSAGARAGQKDLRQFLVNLQRPGGVLIGADVYASQVMLCAQSAMLSVPGDIAFVSVDNDELICENLQPSLTSVMPDFESAGYLLGKLLAARIADPSLHHANRVYGPLGIVRRASSRLPCGHPAIARALEFIRREAVAGIGVDEVATVMGMSRRTSQRLFASFAKRSIAEEIRNVKLSRAMELVRRRNQPLGPIAQMCGFSSSAHLKTAFRRLTGMTMREFRSIASAPELSRFQ